MGWMAGGPRVGPPAWACLGGCIPILLNYDGGGDQPAMCHGPCILLRLSLAHPPLLYQRTHHRCPYEYSHHIYRVGSP